LSEIDPERTVPSDGQKVGFRPTADIGAYRRGSGNAINSRRWAHRSLHHGDRAGAASPQHIGEPAKTPSIAAARGPLDWNEGLADAVPDWDILAQPEPEYLFDQPVQW
jgi:hypothetical protein